MENIEKVDPNKTKGQGTGPKPGSGGRRVGAGRKKGTKNAKTVAKEEAVKHLAQQKMLKDQIIEALPVTLKKSDKALREAIKELDTEEVTEFINKRIALHSSTLVTSMLSAAMGQQFLYKVVLAVDDKGKPKKKHIQVTDPDEIRQYLDNPLEVQGEDYFYITEKQPDVNAINSLLDRFMGRATTKVVGATNPDGSEGPIKVVVANFGGLPAPDPAPVVEAVVQEVIEEQDGN